MNKIGIKLLTSYRTTVAYPRGSSMIERYVNYAPWMRV